jgi:two-component system cell cycle sensor histidine kinase/response regulator CckA
MNGPLHPLLVRQLKRCFGSLDAVPAACQSLVAVVNDAYQQADVDRQMLERSLELSSEELGDLNANLRQAVLDLKAAHHEMEDRVVERTKALDAANESLRQAQKMEAVGTLAGGIAHDFNNLLTVIDGSTDILLDACGPQDPARVELQEVRRATERATALTQQLLAFGRKQVLAPRTIDLNRVVLDMQRMLSRLVREDIALIAEPASEPAWVRLDPNQIEQVLLNLVLNARDALPNGGVIRIALSRVADPARVRITVTDNGIGMPPAVRDRVFEPFFTTKGSKGSGLGLASAHGIVHQSHGSISVESVEGAGTAFTMLFPAAVSEQPSSGPASAANGVNGDTESVLLVEDEDGVRRVLRMMLERRGFRVIEAATPLEACRLFDEHATDIDVLVTDVIMPEINGPALAKRLLAIEPDLPVLFISGHADVESSLLGLDKPGIGFLPKPLQAAQLTSKIRELLAVSRAR